MLPKIGNSQQERAAMATSYPSGGWPSSCLFLGGRLSPVWAELCGSRSPPCMRPVLCCEACCKEHRRYILLPTLGSLKPHPEAWAGPVGRYRQPPDGHGSGGFGLRWDAQFCHVWGQPGLSPCGHTVHACKPIMARLWGHVHMGHMWTC